MNYQLKCLVSLIIVKTSKFINSLSKLIINFIPPLMKPSKQTIFFQTQSFTSRNCGVHALNNLLGLHIYTKNQINNICFSLSSQFINPYKSVLGGDFDVTALLEALSRQNKQVRWLKKDEEISNIFNQPDFVGFLINSELKKHRILTKFLSSGRHWSCVKKIGEKYAHLDSLESQPKIFQEQAQAVGMLQIFREKGGTILIVTEKKNAV